MSSLGLPQIRLPSGSRLFWKKKRSAVISDVDPQYRVTYLGNVLTGWAKGSGCVDKPLATLWRNHVGSDKPNIVMKLTICASGLKAVTKEHGLTEYWANRITYCAADPNYPKVFCWIYRHEGRKMKQELRCHAVLCPSEKKARLMATRLQERLHQALVDFRKEKMSRQNARLSLANSIYENPTMPCRKILLHTGSSNYRPSPDRAKSAPKLKMIEEAIVEEDEEEAAAEAEALRLQAEATAAAAASAGEVSPSLLRRSKSTPLALDDDRSVMTFQLEGAAAASTAETSLASGMDAVGVLVDFSEDPTPSFEPMNLEDRLKQAPHSATNREIIARFDEEDSSDEEDDDDRDEIKDYLIRPSGAADACDSGPPNSCSAAVAAAEAANTKLRLSTGDSVEIDSGASVSPDSNQFSTRSSSTSSTIVERKLKQQPAAAAAAAATSSPRGAHLPETLGPGAGGDADSLGEEEDEDEEEGRMAVRLEADTISDESGYSEESSNAKAGGDSGRAAAAPAAGRRGSNVTRAKEMHSGMKTIVLLNASVGEGEDDCDKRSNRVPIPAPRAMTPRTPRAARSPGSPASPIQCDLTVHSALISDFLDKTTKGDGGVEAADSPNVDFLQGRITEFCINI